MVQGKILQTINKFTGMHIHDILNRATVGLCVYMPEHTGYSNWRPDKYLCRPSSAGEHREACFQH